MFIIFFQTLLWYCVQSPVRVDAHPYLPNEIDKKYCGLCLLGDRLLLSVKQRYILLLHLHSLWRSCSGAAPVSWTLTFFDWTFLFNSQRYLGAREIVIFLSTFSSLVVCRTSSNITVKYACTISSFLVRRFRSGDGNPKRCAANAIKIWLCQIYCHRIQLWMIARWQVMPQPLYTVMCDALRQLQLVG